MIFSGLMIPFLGTTLGAGMVFFMKGSMNQKLEKMLLGFAAGVMIAASVWSLLIPSIEMTEQAGGIAWIPACVGFLLGMIFLLLLDSVIPHLHLDSDKPEGPKTKLGKSAMLVLAVTLHNIPEGMAVGVTFAGVLIGNTGITLSGAFALALGIAIQNFPEGAIISMPLCSLGVSKKRAFLYGVLSDFANRYHCSISSIFFVVCGRCYDLRCGGRIDSGITNGGAYQYSNHRCGGWFYADDGS